MVIIAKRHIGYKCYTSSTMMRKKYIFPLILLILLIVATLFRFSGSSFGPFYDYYFSGSSSDNLVAGGLRGVRTDEWLVATQWTIAQEASGYPLVNESIGDGKNMSLITDVPYLEWSTLFKPQNLSFFVLPFENAFAFKWWFLLVALLLSVYFFVLRFLPKRYLLASLIAATTSVVPFVFWWYQSITIMPIVWSLVALTVGMRILDNRPLPFITSKKHALALSQAILTLLFVYAAVAFALVLYPAFQIPLLIVAVLVFAGYVLNVWLSSDATSRKKLWKNIWIILAAGVAAAGIVGIFLLTRIDAIKEITGTVYPGARNIESGSVSAKNIIGMLSFNQYRLLDDGVQASIPSNQSEASTFVVLSFVFIVPLLYMGYRRWKLTRKIDWIIVSICAINMLFLLHIFVPGLSLLSKLFLLHVVPVPRLLIGFGVLGMISLTYLIYLQLRDRSKRKLSDAVFIISYTVLFAASMVIGMVYLESKFPDFQIRLEYSLVFIAILTAALLLLLLRKYIASLCCFLAVSIFFSASIQPIYMGLGDFYKGSLINAVSRISEGYPGAVWGVSGDIVLENVPIMAGQRSIGGTQFSPDNKFWSHIEPSDSDFIYNRYAHIMFDEDQTEVLKLIQADRFHVKLDCSSEVSNTITHIVSSKPLKSFCYRLVDTVNFPTRSVYLYQKD